MKRPCLGKTARAILNATDRYAPQILMLAGISGVISTVVMAIKATPKTMARCEALRKRKGEEPTKLEYAKATWKCYLGTAITGAISIACLIGSNTVNLRRNAALMTAYGLSETALQNYKEKMIDIIGEKKEKEVMDAVAKSQIEQNPASGREIVFTGSGNTLCYDSISGRYFKSDMEKIKRAMNEINRRMLLEMYISLNDFYYEIGLSGYAISAVLLPNGNVFIAHCYDTNYVLYAMTFPALYISPTTSLSDSAGVAKTAATAGSNVEIYSPA